MRGWGDSPGLQGARWWTEQELEEPQGPGGRGGARIEFSIRRNTFLLVSAY